MTLGAKLLEFKTLITLSMITAVSGPRVPAGVRVALALEEV